MLDSVACPTRRLPPGAKSTFENVHGCLFSSHLMSDDSTAQLFVKLLRSEFKQPVKHAIAQGFAQEDQWTSHKSDRVSCLRLLCLDGFHDRLCDQ